MNFYQVRLKFECEKQAWTIKNNKLIENCKKHGAQIIDLKNQLMVKERENKDLIKTLNELRNSLCADETSTNGTEVSIFEII